MNTWNHLTVCKQISSKSSFKKTYLQTIHLQLIFIKKDLALKKQIWYTIKYQPINNIYLDTIVLFAYLSFFNEALWLLYSSFQGRSVDLVYIISGLLQRLG